MATKKQLKKCVELLKKKVIIVLWRGWRDEGDFIDSKPGGCSVYEKTAFDDFIDSLDGWQVKLRNALVYDGNITNYVWVLERGENG